MTYSRLACLVAVAAVATPLRAQGQRAEPAIVGTWLLESLVDSLANGTLAYWMGPRPSGPIIYSASGPISVQFLPSPRPPLPRPRAARNPPPPPPGNDPFAGLDAAELRDVATGYYAYFGRYEVSAAGDSITHYVSTSLRPTEVGVTYRRAIRMAEGRLFITLHTTVDGVPRHRVLTWRRAG